MVKKHFVTIPAVALMVAFVGSVFIDSGIEWYQTLTLPKSAPSDSVIGAVCTVIYITVISAAILYWNKVKDGTSMVNLFAINIFLNTFWCFIFFNQRQVGLAMFEAIFLELSVLTIMFKMWPVSKNASLLMLPYALWVLFGMYMSYAILQLN